MTAARVLVVTHRRHDGQVLGRGVYCPACATRLTLQTRREYGPPRVIADCHQYDLPDGTVEQHTWHDRPTTEICAGAGCVRQSWGAA